MRLWVRSLASPGIAVSCGVGHKHGSDPTLLWLWHRLAALAPIRPLAWEPPYAAGANLEKTKKKKITFNSCILMRFQQGPYIEFSFFSFFFFCLFKATLAAHGGSQARSGIGAVAAGHATATAMQDPSSVSDLHHSSRQCRIHNPLARPGIEPALSWILVRFTYTEPRGELPVTMFLKCHLS